MTAHVVNVVLSGVFHASILFLVSAGLQVVFGVQKIFNLACGSFYALGAYVGVSAVGWYLEAGGPPALFIAPLAVAGLAVGAVGVVVERGLLRFVYDRDETFQLLLTFAIVLMMEDAIRLTWGTSPRSTSGLYLTYGRVGVLGHRCPEHAHAAVGQVEAGGGAGRRAPGQPDRVLHHEDDGEGQEELEGLVAVVDEAQEAALDDDADRAHGEPRDGQRRDEQRGRPARLQVPADRRDPDVGAERVEGAAREVEDLLHAEDDLESRRHQKQNAGVEHAAEHNVDDVSCHDVRDGFAGAGGGPGQPSETRCFWASFRHRPCRSAWRIER